MSDDCKLRVVGERLPKPLKAIKVTDGAINLLPEDAYTFCTQAEYDEALLRQGEGWGFERGEFGGRMRWQAVHRPSWKVVYGDCLADMLERIKNHVQGEALWTTISTQTRCTKPKRRGCCTS